MTRKDKFITWYFNEFRRTQLARNMSNTVEDSPWHREKNVLIHTDMVVTQYVAMCEEKNWSQSDLEGALACAFHDVGKPEAEEERFSEERGTYRRYAGHEKISARLFENYFISNDMLQYFELPPESMYNIGWVIENHLPYQIKKPHKREALSLTVHKTVGIEAFARVLQADCWGRISDNHHAKKDDVNDWITDFCDVSIKTASKLHTFDSSKPTVYMLIGPSNSGKSTYVNAQLSTYNYYSWDALRFEWYSQDYREAFRLSCEDKDFMKKAQDEFMKMVKTNESIVVDNINVNPKRRSFFVNAARQKGYNIVALLFPTDLNTITVRGAARTEQHVPQEAIERQYMSLGLPSCGEVDSVDVILPQKSE